MFVFLFLLYSITTAALHPIHVSVSDVEVTEKEIIWSARIYKDDLLLGMYGKEINMSVLDDHDKVEKDIHKYLMKNIAFQLDNKTLKWDLQSIDADHEAIWITVSAALNGTYISNTVIINRILFDVYKDQKNVVNLQWTSGKKNLVFEKGREKVAVKF